MEVIKEQAEIQYSLRLTAAEASWLKGIMQNPFWGQHPTEEAEEDRENRHALFDTLNIQGVK